MATFSKDVELYGEDKETVAMIKAKQAKEEAARKKAAEAAAANEGAPCFAHERLLPRLPIATIVMRVECLNECVSGNARTCMCARRAPCIDPSIQPTTTPSNNPSNNPHPRRGAPAAVAAEQPSEEDAVRRQEGVLRRIGDGVRG